MTRFTPCPDTDLLLIIDVQNDFCPGGALAVPDGDAIVPLINDLSRRFTHVAVTQDWHPAGHASFASSHPGRKPFETISLPYGEQVLWPDHCIEGTHGAAFHPGLDLHRARLIIRKGYRPDIDSYSAFFDNDRRTPTGLNGYLREQGVRRVVCAGLATDFCVRFSADDAATLGFETTVVTDACRAIDLNGSLDESLRFFEEKGIRTLTAAALL